MKWAERVSTAQTRDSFTRDDVDDADKWPRCAVGEQEGIPRDSAGLPCDELLQKLGVDFNSAVRRNDFELAEDRLKWIEKRSGEVRMEAQRGLRWL